MPEYQVAHRIEAARLNKAAEASAVKVGEDIQRASNYVLTVVLYAVVLFFAGMSTKLRSRRLRTITVVAGWHGAGVHPRVDRDVPGEREGLTPGPRRHRAPRPPAAGRAATYPLVLGGSDGHFLRLTGIAVPVNRGFPRPTGETNVP